MPPRIFTENPLKCFYNKLKYFMQAEHNLNMIVCECFTSFLSQTFVIQKYLKTLHKLITIRLNCLCRCIATWVDSDFCYTIISGLFSLTEF